MSILELDVGSRRIGRAISDPSEQYALPLSVIARTTSHADIQAILDTVAEHVVTTIVVGDPVRLDGERGLAARRIDEFCEILARAFPGAIERVDERMTTAQATKTLIAADVSRRKRKQLVDGVAAMLMLDTYLRRRRSARP